LIPRNLTATVAILCSLTLGMSLYLWQLRRREIGSGPRETVPQHVTAPVLGQTEKISLIVAHDDTGQILPQSLSIAVSNNQQQQAEEILRQLLDVYQRKDSPHPLTGSAEIRDVYLVQPGIAVVDVNSAFADGQTSGILAEELTVVSFIQTLSVNLPNLTGVKILVDGKERETLAGHVDISGVYSTAEVSQLAKQMGPQ